MIDDEADLIAVAGEHDARFPSGIAQPENVAHHICPDLVAPWSDSIPDQLLHIVLVARGAGGFYQSLKEIFAVAVHYRLGRGPSLLKGASLTIETSKFR